jgi:uncharacterized protein (DUF2252 family)
MPSLDPYRLARRQLDRDRAATAGWPHLFEHKLDRMRPSPFAFLRGTAPLFYEVLAEEPSLRRGPPGRGWIVGDAHLENLGVFRPGGFDQPESALRRGPPRAVFDFNDFDDASLGPLRLDVIRLTTSLLLAARDHGIDASRAVASAGALIRAHSRRLFQPRTRMPSPPPAVTQLLEKVIARRRKDLLDEWSEVVDGTLRIKRSRNLLEVPGRLRQQVIEALPRYVARLPEQYRPTEEQAQVVDVVFRVAGTGGLGHLRLAVLVVGKGCPDGCWIFDLKEQGAPSTEVLLGKMDGPPAKRVVEGMRTCLQFPPRLLGTLKLDGRSMVVRRLAPQEDKLDPKAITAESIEPIAACCGALLGNAHRRGAAKLPGRGWQSADRHELLESAVRLAALHEAAWLAYFDLLE